MWCQLLCRTSVNATERWRFRVTSSGASRPVTFVTWSYVVLCNYVVSHRPRVPTGRWRFRYYVARPWRHKTGFAMMDISVGGKRPRTLMTTAWTKLWSPTTTSRQTCRRPTLWSLRSLSPNESNGFWLLVSWILPARLNEVTLFLCNVTAVRICRQAIEWREWFSQHCICRLAKLRTDFSRGVPVSTTLWHLPLINRDSVASSRRGPWPNVSCLRRCERQTRRHSRTGITRLV